MADNPTDDYMRRLRLAHHLTVNDLHRPPPTPEPPGPLTPGQVEACARVERIFLERPPERCRMSEESVRVFYRYLEEKHVKGMHR